MALVVAAEGPATATAPGGAATQKVLPVQKKVVGALMLALNAGDEAKVRATLVIAKEHEDAVAAMLKMTAATAQLQLVAVKTFGEEGSKAFGKVSAELTEGRLKAIRDAEMNEEGDTTKIVIAEDRSLGYSGGELLLKKIGGEWKIDAGSLFQLNSYKAEELKQRIALAGKMTALTGDVTKEIAAGKFTAAEEARVSFWKRADAISKEGAATTQGK